MKAKGVDMETRTLAELTPVSRRCVSTHLSVWFSKEFVPPSHPPPSQRSFVQVVVVVTS